MKATAIAHPIQGLVKYHGLKDAVLRIPYHDSISVCVEALKTTTTVETTKVLREDLIVVNGRALVQRDKKRAEIVLNELKRIARYTGHFKVVSENSLREGKGLGFSASGFAALGVATCEALNLDIDYISLSEVVRMGAGSATRSLAGGFAVWYADRNGRSYAEQLAGPGVVDLAMVIVPIPLSVKTDEAHTEVLSSPLFKARLEHINTMIEEMNRAIKVGDVSTIGRLAEEDSLNLHAITMTGKSHMVLWEPDTIRVIKQVLRMRAEGFPAWYSIDTGPSVFINTFQEKVEKVAAEIRKLKPLMPIISKIGGKPTLRNKHLF